MAYFGGTHWACDTFAGSQETHAYVATGPTSLTLHVAFVTASSRTIVLDENYSFDPSRPAWTATLGEGSYTGVSEEWNATDWVFTGRETVGRTKVPFREAYHIFGREAFRRDFLTLHKGKWLPYAGETCELTPS